VGIGCFVGEEHQQRQGKIKERLGECLREFEEGPYQLKYINEDESDSIKYKTPDHNRSGV
jgi:hypothetical protein